MTAAAAALRRAWRARTGPFARQGSLSMADQMLVSATSFLAGLLLARHAPPSEFGAYALASSVLLLLAGLQSALVTTPLTILAAPLRGMALRRNVSTIAAASLAFGVAVGVAAAVGAAAVNWLAPASGLSPVLLAMAVATPFVMCQELCRRVLFMRLLPGRVLANDLLYCSLQIGLLLLLLRHDSVHPRAERLLTGQMVFLAMAVAAAAGTLLGAWQIRKLFTRALTGAVTVLRQTWALGKWGLGAQLGQIMSVHANRFIAAAFAGTAGVALLEAPRLLVSPLHIIGTGAGNLMLPNATRRFARGGMPAMLRFLTPVGIVWAAVFVGYSALVAVAAPFWLDLFFGGKYAEGRWILVVWCAVHALIGLRMLPSTSLRATRNLRQTMVASVASGLVVVVASLWLCATLGPGGAAVAKLAGEIVLLATLGVFFVRLLRGRYAARSDNGAGIEAREI